MKVWLLDALGHLWKRKLKRFIPTYLTPCLPSLSKINYNKISFAGDNIDKSSRRFQPLLFSNRSQYLHHVVLLWLRVVFSELLVVSQRHGIKRRCHLTGQSPGEWTDPGSGLDSLLSSRTDPGFCSHVSAGAATVHTLTHNTTHCSDCKSSLQLLGDPDSSPGRCLMRRCVNPISLLKVFSVSGDSATLRLG